MFENRIREIREQQGMTQVELAQKARISRTILSNLETKRNCDCKISTMLAVAVALGQPFESVFLIS